MKLLVIGGTYFLGKAFVRRMAGEHDLTLLNRGNRPVEDGVRQIVMDRHALKQGQFAAENYDAVVDFCAYERGDIRQVLDAFCGEIKQYIFVSTSDVYKRGLGITIDETGEFETRDFGGEIGAYILGKVALEQEICEMCGKRGIRYNSVRPAFIYGPNNYAGREAVFFDWIDRAGQILYPTDATGSFHMVYVEDVARAIAAIVGNESCFDKAFNLIGEKPVTYESFCDALQTATGKNFERVGITVDEIYSRQIPLPFPLTRQESEAYTTMYGDLLSVKYTELADGLRATYESRGEGEK